MKQKEANTELLLSTKPELAFIVGVLSKKISTDYTNLHRLNFTEFIRLIKHHRLDSIFYRAVKEQKIALPKELETKLADIDRRNRMRMMKLTAELIRIHKLFTENGIDYISLKGPALSQQIYGDYTVRSSRDLDILVRVEDLDRVKEILNNIDYQTLVTNFNKHEKAHHDIEFINKKLKVKLEIHTKLFSFDKLLNYDINTLFNNCTTVLINNSNINILNKEINSEYLYTHAKNHSWELFYWITDLLRLNKNTEDLLNLFISNCLNNKREGRLSYFVYLLSLNKSKKYKYSVMRVHLIRFKNWLKRKFATT